MDQAGFREGLRFQGILRQGAEPLRRAATSRSELAWKDGSHKNNSIAKIVGRDSLRYSGKQGPDADPNAKANANHSTKRLESAGQKPTTATKALRVMAQKGTQEAKLFHALEVNVRAGSRSDCH